jgi:hypothetical protein
MTELQPQLFECFERKEKPARLGCERTKIIAFVERLRPLILGIDDDRMHRERRARPDDAADRIEQQPPPRA